LPEKYRLPTLLHYLEGYSLKEIARILRIPESKVKSRLHQARGKLRDLLGGEDYEA
jgi:RNA polymerase sigma-70 factor (ECF subfamily)